MDTICLVDADTINLLDADTIYLVCPATTTTAATHGSSGRRYGPSVPDAPEELDLTRERETLVLI